jgi:hypothetical protein
MPVPNTARPEELVLARVPAGAARYCAEHLANDARECERSGETADAALLSVAGHALHAAGWADQGARLAEASNHLERCDNLGVPTVALHLPHELADALLVARGWRIERITDRWRAYVMPGGRGRADGGTFGIDFLWERDEAVTLALAAEALEVNR